MNTEFSTSAQNLEITQVTKSIFLETAKWAKFLAILGFIGIGIMIIAGFFMGAIMSSFGAMSEFSGTPNPFGMIGGAFFVILYLFIALIYYFPIKYLYDFSTKVKKAFEVQDQMLFNEAILKLKSHYKYIGIVMIIVFSLYILMIIFTIIGGIAAAAMS